MTEWNKIYPKERISGADGFTFVTLPFITWPEKDANEWIEQFVPEEKHGNDFAMARAKADPISAVRMYLCQTMSSTFCIGRGDRNQQSVYYIGARRPQDIFKLILKIPNATKTKTWPTDTNFSIRVAENDDFNPHKHRQGII